MLYLPKQTPHTHQRLPVGLSNQGVGLLADVCMLLSRPNAGTHASQTVSHRGEECLSVRLSEANDQNAFSVVQCSALRSLP